jgi:hypothetical protein
MCEDDPDAEAVGLLRKPRGAPGLAPHVTSWITCGLLPRVRNTGRHIRPADLAATQASALARAVVPAWLQDPRHAGKRLRIVGTEFVGQGRPTAADRCVGIAELIERQAGLACSAVAHAARVISSVLALPLEVPPVLLVAGVMPLLMAP